MISTIFLEEVLTGEILEEFYKTISGPAFSRVGSLRLEKKRRLCIDNYVNHDIVLLANERALMGTIYREELIVIDVRVTGGDLGQEEIDAIFIKAEQDRIKEIDNDNDKFKP